MLCIAHRSPFIITFALFHSNLCLYCGSSKIADPRDMGQGIENGFEIWTRTFRVRLTEKHWGISHLNQKLLIIALNCPQIRTLWTGKAWVNPKLRGQPYSPPSLNTNLVSLTAAFLRKSGLTQALPYPGHKMQIDALTFRLPCAIWKSLSSPYCTAASPRELGLRKLCQIRVHKTQMHARTFHLSCAICKSLSSHPNCFSTSLENRSPDRQINKCKHKKYLPFYCKAKSPVCFSFHLLKHPLRSRTKVQFSQRLLLQLRQTKPLTVSVLLGFISSSHFFRSFPCFFSTNQWSSCFFLPLLIN